MEGPLRKRGWSEEQVSSWVPAFPGCFAGGWGGLLHTGEPALALRVCDRCDTLKPRVAVQCLGSFLVLTQRESQTRTSGPQPLAF